MFKLVQNLARSGERIENLVIGLADARQALHDTFEALKRHEVLISGQVAAERKNSQPAFPNEDTRKAEVVRRLETDPEYQKLKMKLQDARVNLAFAEAELERAKADHAGLVAMTGLITAMVNAGKIDDVERFVHDVLGSDNLSDKHQTRDSGNAGCNNPVGTSSTSSETAVAGPEGDELETGVFMVLEARESRPGTVRGYCQSADGNKVAVYAKNSHGQFLAGAVGQFVQISYRKGDKGLIATSVKLAR